MDEKRGSRILLVNDYESELRLMEAILENQNYSFQVAQNGYEAIEKAGSFLPDLILLDIIMPGLNGFDVCRKLKSNPATRYIPVVFVTVLDDKEMRLRGLECGAIDFLTKPIDTIEFTVRIKNILKIKEFEEFLKKHAEILSSEVDRQTRKLKKSESDMRSVLSAVPDVMLRADKNGKCLECLAQTGKLVSLTGDEPEGRNLTEIMPENISRILETKIKKALETMSLQTLEYSVDSADKDGKLYFEARIVPQESEDALILMRDITERKRSDEQLCRTVDKLQKATEDVIRMMAKLSEIRDPYTSGHQRRVAEIAEVIAGEMGLDVSTKKSILMTGLIHDIGKIAIPIELLSKPGSLNNMVFDIIKTHCREGAGLLDGLDLPWPISEILVQHHERIDGSGYPEGLEGPDIRIEARILAVADVIEAMSSHRPYRPALGIEQAIEEIKKNRGILYDPDVVDACIKGIEGGRITLPV